MFRFVVGCVLVAALCVGAVVVFGQKLPELFTRATAQPPESTPKDGTTKPRESNPTSADTRPSAAEPVRTTAVEDNKEAKVQIITASNTVAQPTPLPDGRIQVVESQNVPAERDGKLMFLATPVRPGEFVTKQKLLEFEVPTLAIEVDLKEWPTIPEDERVRDIEDGTKLYRTVRPKDSLAPGTTVIVRQKVRFRKLDVGDRVIEGQTLGVINPALALDDLYIKQANIEAIDSEVRMALALKTEYDRRAAQLHRLRLQAKGAASDDDYFAALATAARYKEEQGSKLAGRSRAQRELSASLTTLKQHLVKATVGGTIRAMYKQPGEAVKNLDPVLQIQNPDLLRVEAQVEIQEALNLRDRIEQARKLRETAREIRQNAEQRGEGRIPEQAQQLMNKSDALLAVEIEASRVEPPRAVLTGHLQEVTCVAVSKGADPKIVSGSEDNTVRVWERVPNSERWQEKARLDHFAALRAIACTPATATRNLLLTATSTGRGRLFDLDALEDSKKQIMLGDRHGGPINAVTFSKDGTMCATAGEDRAICLWETKEGQLLGRVKGAHGAGVTSLTFTPNNQLVSAGKDRRLVVWEIVDGGEGGKTLKSVESFDRRSNLVPTLGIDPEGKHVLFDEGKELRVLSLQTRKILGSLTNPQGAPNFANFALYSPDGATILTDGNSTGRLQLWRAPTSKLRAAELRNFAWANGNITSGAFDPNGQFAATGSKDARVLVWSMPSKAEAEKPLPGQLSYVEDFLDTSMKRIAVRATLDNPGWIIPGGGATIVVPPMPATK